MAKSNEIADAQTEAPNIVVEEVPERIVTADEGIEGLRKQLEAEKSRREVAERQAHEAAGQVHRANAEIADTNLQLVTTAIETVKGQTSALKAAYADAMSKGDYTKAADIQIEMSNSAARMLQLAQHARGHPVR